MFEILAAALAPTVTKILLKAYFGDTTAELGGTLTDIASKWVKDRAEQRRAVRLVEDLADQIINKLAPLFMAESPKGIAVEAVAHEVGKTLAVRPALKMLLKGDLDAERITTAYKKRRPLPQGYFSIDETAFYERALRQVVHHMTIVAHKLPNFDSGAVGESLQRLSNLASDTAHIRSLLEEYREERRARTRSEVERTEGFEADYRAAVARNLDYVELLGFGHKIQRDTRELPLSVAYISLNLESLDRKTVGSIPLVNLLDQLGRSTERLLILGEAGSGKTTLSRWTAVNTMKSTDDLLITIGRHQVVHLFDHLKFKNVRLFQISFEQYIEQFGDSLMEKKRIIERKNRITSILYNRTETIPSEILAQSRSFLDSVA